MDGIVNSLLEIRDILNPKWTCKLSEIKKDLKTGDIVLVHGKYPYSWVVQYLQNSKWTHVAMVVLTKDIDPNNTLNLPEVLLWESNTKIDGGPNNLWGTKKEIKEGPMLIDLEWRLSHSEINFEDVEIAYKPLLTSFNLPVNKLPKVFDDMILKEFPSDQDIIYSVYLGRKYNRTSLTPQGELKLAINGKKLSLVQIDESKIERLSKTDINDKGEIYCSELLAYTYKILELITSRHVSNAYAPEDFSDTSNVGLLKRSIWGPEVFFTTK